MKLKNALSLTKSRPIRLLIDLRLDCQNVAVGCDSAIETAFVSFVRSE